MADFAGQLPDDQAKRDGTWTVVAARPNCDVHMMAKPGSPRVEALYDGKTTGGPWAYMCQECFDEHGVGLGIGRGQRLLLPAEAAEVANPGGEGVTGE